MRSAVAVAEAQDRCEWHLANWSTWHRIGGVKLWYPSRAGSGIGASGSSDFDSMCANVDAACAYAVDAIIDDLPQRQRLSIYNEWLCTVFRFEGDPVALYDAAKAAIERGLAKRGMW